VISASAGVIEDDPMNAFETGLVESVLYLHSEPIDVKTLSRITNLPRSAVLEAIGSLKEEYDREKHGLEIVEIGGGFCFSPKKPYYQALRSTYGRQNMKRFSRAAMETLAIIAYSQPITKAEIESIRGVSADGMIKLLTEYRLIKEVGKRDTPGKPIQFGTTKDFLVRFGLKSIANLPKLEETESQRFDPYERE
jgi:segregation and condensation protein B